MPFTPVDAPNLSEAAAAQIRELIAVDVLRPGDSLPGERELAERMGISRTSIRAASQSLVAEGLLVSRHGSGLRVADTLAAAITDPLTRLLSSTPDAIGDYLHFRAILEGECAAEAAAQASPPERTEIRRAHDAMLTAVETGDMDAATLADIEFHMSIVEATGNVVSIQIARSLHDLLRQGIERSHRLTSADPGAWAALAAQHTGILNAIEAGDTGTARTTMRTHLAFQQDLLRRETATERRQTISQKRRTWTEERG